MIDSSIDKSLRFDTEHFIFQFPRQIRYLEAQTIIHFNYFIKKIQSINNNRKI
jgi:hypothetical protein